MDKIKHYIYSIVITLVLGLFLPIHYAALAAFLIGVGKEVIWDLMLKKGQFEWLDLLTDLLGCLTGMGILLLIF